MIEKILKYKMTWAKALSVIVLISFSLIPLLLLSVSGAFFNLRELLERIRPIVETLAPAFAIGGVVIAIGFYLVRFLTDITTEARDYARKMGSGSQQAPDLSGTEIDEEKSKQVREIASAVLIDVEKLRAAAAEDLSKPEGLFHASRTRLLDEAVRLNAISSRNLIIGILFSFIALLILAWPLFAQAFFPTDKYDGIMDWFARYYLPRFAVGLLLQFVGFFFLRLYVANELDLKHNKNELTNIEMRMLALQLAKDQGDAASRKEVIKSLMATERNFLIKKNEKSISTEGMSEYNDMKSIAEKALSKVPAPAK